MSILCQARKYFNFDEIKYTDWLNNTEWKDGIILQITSAIYFTYKLFSGNTIYNK